MTNTPWMKFYPSDWRADPALRMCSIAARGLWMEMLCIMHEASPRGSLLINGNAVSDRQLASLAGLSLKEVTALIRELEDAGVFSREDNGTVYSRRMRRDDERAERDKANGKRGGNPRVKGVVGNGVDRGVNPRDKAQKPEARDQNPEEGRDRQERAAIPPTEGDPSDPVAALRKAMADLWWQHAKRHGWTKPPPDTGCAAVWLNRGWQHPTIVAVLTSRLSAAKRAPGSWSYFEGALDEEHTKRAAKNGAAEPEKPVDPARERAHQKRMAINFFQSEYWLVGYWGPRPDEPGCPIPADIIAEAARECGKEWHPPQQVHH